MVLVQGRLLYYPTVTREPYRNRGRLTNLMHSGKLFEDLGLPALDAAHDRAMICGSPSMLEDTWKLLDAGFRRLPIEACLHGVDPHSSVLSTNRERLAWRANFRVIARSPWKAEAPFPVLPGCYRYMVSAVSRAASFKEFAKPFVFER